MSQIYSKITPEILNKLKEVCKKTTQVVGWYPYSGGDGYGKEATVRGPYFRWFKCTEPLAQYKDNVAYVLDDVEFCAAAMNALPGLLTLLDEKDAEIEKLKSQLEEWKEEAAYRLSFHNE